MVARRALIPLLLLPWLAAAGTPPVDYHAPPPDPPGAGAVANAPPIADRLTGPGPFRNLPAIDESRWVPLPPRQQPYWSFGKIEPVLTEACRLGEFATPQFNRIILQFNGNAGRAVMQVVPPLYRHLLFDSRKLARAGVTYYFLDAGQPDCEVRVDARLTVGQFPDGHGSALPPPDAKTLQRRKALIKSWPQ